MTAAVVAFAAVGSHPVLYALTSAVLGLSYGLALPAAQAQVVNVSAADVRPQALPLAGLIFQAAALTFPLAAGAIVATFGYAPLFAVLVLFAFVQAAISWRAVRHRQDTDPDPVNGCGTPRIDVPR